MIPPPLPFVGIDDFAFKKRHRYGTLFIDLQTHKPVDVLKTREAAEVTEWLREHPAIELITRDGSKAYASAVTAASPDILQVSDRWHLLHQLFEAVKKTVYGLLPAKWAPPQSAEQDAGQERKEVPPRKSEANRIRNEEKRWKRIIEVQSLSREGYTKAAIQRKLNISSGTVYADLRQTERPNHQRASPFDRFHPLIRSLVQAEQTVKEIEAACRAAGYQGSLSTLNALVASEKRRIRQNKPAAISVRQKVIRLFWEFKESRHQERLHGLHPALSEAFPQLNQLNELVGSFRELFREKETDKLAEWMERHKRCDFPFIQSFIEGVRQDLSAVELSIKEPWSNGPMEGQVNRLKTIKQMMYGRAGFQVLRNRILYQW